MRLLLDRQPITPELEAGLTPNERAGLETLRAAIALGEDIGLARSDSHRTLVDREGRGLVTVVTAAPADRLAPVTWWFPIVGRISYRGYFDAERAVRFARSLDDQGLDTYVRPALLYSTLGWFDDPVPRALLRRRSFEVADTLLHERVHETIFVPGDTTYNESVAVFVAHEAVMRMYEGDTDARKAATAAFADDARFAELLDRLAADLRRLYALELPETEVLDRRRSIFDRYQAEEYDAVPWETNRYSGFRNAALSNAYVVASRTYLADLPCFDLELKAKNGDLAALIRAHRKEPGRRTTPEGRCAFDPGGD